MSSVIGGFLGDRLSSQPDPSRKSPVTTASRSLATALPNSALARGLAPISYTTIRGTTQAWAKIQLCNKFKHPINVALAYDQNGAWVSDGWITINPGQCQIDAKHADLTSFYYYGETGVFDGSRWTWGKTVDRR
jgi:uncharacterized membrane protein